jgi:enediyne polyketide synthase
LAGVVAKEKLESKDASATRVWAASECLSKVGAAVNAPLTLHSIPADGWVLLSSGRYAIATYATRIEGAGERVAVAMLACPGREG